MLEYVSLDEEDFDYLTLEHVKMQSRQTGSSFSLKQVCSLVRDCYYPF